MKKLFFVIFSFIFLIVGRINSNEESPNNLGLKIVEIKGTVDIKKNSDKWEIAKLNDQITDNAVIRCGFHSQITLENEKNCYITINQISEVEINSIKLVEKKRKKKISESASGEAEIDIVRSVEINITISRGYIITYSKRMREILDKRVNINFKNGFVRFNNTSGELYYREDSGTLLRSLGGRVFFGSRLNKLNFIEKGEVALITPGGKLFDNEYFLKRGINAKPNDLLTDSDIESYYNALALPYTINRKRNDYSDHFYP